jgi:broad-specificity NMP kinase
LPDRRGSKDNVLIYNHLLDLRKFLHYAYILQCAYILQTEKVNNRGWKKGKHLTNNNKLIFKKENCRSEEIKGKQLFCRNERKIADRVKKVKQLIR